MDHGDIGGRAEQRVQSHLHLFYDLQSRLNSLSVTDDRSVCSTRCVGSTEDINIPALVYRNPYHPYFCNVIAQ